jgi:XTP/dITP diphosphohydrolase
VESAYFAGPVCDDGANLRKLVDVMRGVPAADRGAHYVCVLTVSGPNDLEASFEGRCHGTLADDPTGGGGFGYDPLFIPTGHSATFGVLAPEIKQALSHRAQAWQELAGWIRRGRRAVNQ